jgi:uncharacterized protein (TIGR03086 family)
MDQNLLDLYKSVSTWTASKVAGATDLLDAPTPCDDWDVRTLLNHMLDTQQYFQAVALERDASPPSPIPPDVLGDDPVADIRQAQAKTVAAFEPDGVIDKTGTSLGIAFSDQLLHGWDLATATQQDATMPDGLPEAAYGLIHGAFTDEQRKGVFKPEIDPGPGASAQAKLLAYTGRDPR